MKHFALILCSLIGLYFGPNILLSQAFKLFPFSVEGISFTSNSFNYIQSLLISFFTFTGGPTLFSLRFFISTFRKSKKLWLTTFILNLMNIASHVFIHIFVNKDNFNLIYILFLSVCLILLYLDRELIDESIPSEDKILI